ncbi:MAG: GNAT family N-acetyltransferase [Coriobacteriia bacterium]
MKAFVELTPEYEDAWRTFVERTAGAGPYHHLEWERPAAVLGQIPRHLLALDGDAVSGVLPLYETGPRRARKLVSVPARDRGGPLAADEASARGLVEAAVSLGERAGARHVELRSVGGLPPAVVAGFEERRHYSTSAIDLAGRDAGSLWAGLDSDERASVRKAERYGVETGWETDASAMRAFYGVFLRTRRRLGVPPYPLEFFEAMRSALVPAGLARLVLARVDGQAVGGVIVLVSGGRAVYGYVAADERFSKMHIGDLLVWRCLEAAVEEGLAVFDFGASSPYQTGLRAFKAKWGGQEVDLPSYRRVLAGRPLPERDSNAPGFRFARRAWSCLPLWLTRLAGAPIARRAD